MQASLPKFYLHLQYLKHPYSEQITDGGDDFFFVIVINEMTVYNILVYTKRFIVKLLIYFSPPRSANALVCFQPCDSSLGKGHIWALRSGTDTLLSIQCIVE